MCGFAGALSRGDDGVDVAAVERMGAALVHRGPDDSGTWVDAAKTVCFAFRRLSILDLSPTGHQPMSSPDGRWTIVFNGEIYNHAELRRDLRAAGHSFRGTSDTEA